MNEWQGTHTNEKPIVESLLEIAEQLRGECLHTEFLSIQRFMPAEQGTRYICARCFKKTIVVPPLESFVQKSDNACGILGGIDLYGGKDE